MEHQWSKAYKPKRKLYVLRSRESEGFDDFCQENGYDWYKCFSNIYRPLANRALFYMPEKMMDAGYSRLYEGACTYPKGAYRPSEDSMMNSNTCAFNAPSRKSLYEKVMKIGMDTEQVLYEDFVTFDKAHLPEMLPVASYTRAAFSGQSFARPVWTGSRLSH